MSFLATLRAADAAERRLALSSARLHQRVSLLGSALAGLHPLLLLTGGAAFGFVLGMFTPVAIFERLKGTVWTGLLAYARRIFAPLG